jgi:predicted NBD/HSP70 family sugar kinase
LADLRNNLLYGGAMIESSGSLTGLRQRNRRQVLEVVRQRGSTSRAEIAKTSGLSTSTVSTLVAELVEDAVLVESDDRAGATGAGRPARVLRFNPAGGGLAGIHLAHQHIRVGLADLADDLIGTRVVEMDVDGEPERALSCAAEAVLGLVEECSLTPRAVHGLGVALSAPVFSSASRRLPAAKILPQWQGVDVAAELRRRTGLSVVVGNDANLGAIAERRFGVAQNVDHLVYVMLSDGVGGGLILEGRLYEGALGFAGELGHVPVTRDGLICRCGNRGCLETVAGGRAISAALTLTGHAGSSVPEVVAAAGAGDEGARRVLVDAGHAVGQALVPVCTVLDPSLVVVGGEAAGSAELTAAARQSLARGLTPLRRDPIPVVAGALGEQAEMLGAITLAAQRLELL